jgi:hypothetical protein
MEMSKVKPEEQVLPRPVEKLPEFAHAKSRRALAERLISAFGLSEQAANATADAVVDPSTTRRNIGEPLDPQVEELPVPGGKILGIRVSVWARRVMPDPRNPRIGPSRRHPFAVDPGTGSEDSRFRPVPEPRVPEGKADDAPELVVEIESRHHLEWASAQAAKYVLAQNDWRASIEAQGVMEAVWVVPTTYNHADGAAPVTVLTTVEGSSRTTAVHALLSIRSADVPYDDYDLKLRAHYRKLNEALERGATSNQLVALRCERIPALILVGFRRNSSETADFGTAVKSLVALRHVDPPKPWGEGPENESLADQVLLELYRRSLITATERAYLAGSFTKVEARAAHLSDDPAHRTSRIVQMFTTGDERIKEAIRVAVTSQSTRKRITPKLLNELATALIMRSLAEDPAKTDQVRRYMRHAFGKAVHGKEWASTERDTEVLANEAISEVLRSVRDVTVLEPGKSSLELAVRASYPLVTTGSLNADRGTRSNNQPDRRTPGEVLDAMRRTVQGVHQLAQALRDLKSGQLIRAVDESGEIRKRADGSGDQIVSDFYLREEFPPAGKIRARSAGITPTEILKDRLVDFSEALEKLGEAFTAIGSITGNDGLPLVEVDGVDSRHCGEWRKTLSQIADDLNFWGRTFRRRYKPTPGLLLLEDADDGDDTLDTFEPEVEDVYESSYEGWDNDKSADDKEELPNSAQF